MCHALGELLSFDGSFDLHLKVWKGKQESQESAKLVKPVKKSIQSKSKKGQSKKTKATKTTRATKTPVAKKSRVKDVAIKLEEAAHCDVDSAQNREQVLKAKDVLMRCQKVHETKNDVFWV